MDHFLAVDAGGTSTRAVIVSTDARCIGYAVSGGGNPISSGPERAAIAVADATRRALAVADIDPPSLASAMLAMAGSRTYLSTEWITSRLAGLGFTGSLALESDLLATFCSGTPSDSGYAIVAGTGAAAVRVEDGRIAFASDGLGWLLGDDGSGFWIGREVVRAAVAALDSRAATTALSDALLQSLEIDKTTALTEDGRPDTLRQAVDALYALLPVQLARFAPLAFACADDPTAQRILHEATLGLTRTLDAVVRDEVGGPVVLGGGVLAQLRDVPPAIEARQRETGHPADTRRVSDGAVGAVVLTLRDAGIPVGEDEFERIARSLALLR